MKFGSRTLGYAFLQQVTFQGFQFLSFLILVRILTPTNVGIWTLYLTFHAFFEMARTSFIHNGFIKYWVGEVEERNGIFSAALCLQFISALLIVGLFAGIAWGFADKFQAPQLHNMALFYPLVALPACLFQMLRSFLVAQNDFKSIWFGVMGLGASLFTGVILMYIWDRTEDLILLQRFQILGYCLGMLILYALSRKELPRLTLSGKWIGKLFHFGKYSMGSGIGSMLFTKMDVFMLGYLVGPAAVGIYSVATRINNYLDLPQNAFSQAYYPQISSKIQESGIEFPLLTVRKAIAMMWIFAIPTALVFLIFPKPILFLLAGETYYTAAPLLQIFACMVLIKPFGRVFGITLDAIGKPQWNFHMLLVSLVINAIMNYLLIQLMGIQGAAWGTMLATWVSILMGQYLISRFFKISYKVLIQGIVTEIYQTLQRIIPSGHSKYTTKEFQLEKNDVHEQQGIS